MTTERLEMDEFDVLLNDVLRTVANPELPELVRVQVRTRVWVREIGRPTSQKRDVGHPQAAVLFAPDVFLAKMSPKRDARSTGAAVLLHVAAIALLFWAVKEHVPFVKHQAMLLVQLATPPEMPKAKDVIDRKRTRLN